MNYIGTDVVTQRVFNPMFNSDPDTYKKLYQGIQGNCDAQGICDFQLTMPTSIGEARIKGLSIAYQQPFGNTGFGMVANYTYADGSTQNGSPLPYNSKNSVTVSPYFQGQHFTARMTYNWRSHYTAGGYVAGAPPSIVGDYTELDATFGWKFNKHWSVSLAAMNLLNEKYQQYINKSQPTNMYTNGRRYMAKLHFNF